MAKDFIPKGGVVEHTRGRTITAPAPVITSNVKQQSTTSSPSQTVNGKEK